MVDFNRLWRPIASAPQGVEVETKVDRGTGSQVQVMTLADGLWWIGDIYVYYVTTHWRPKADEH